MTNCLTTTALCQSDKCSVTTTEQRCVLTISVPLGVGEAPVENSWGSYEIKKCDSKKVSFIWHLQMDTLHAQNLEFIHHELACSRSDQAKVVFWQMQKLKLSISKIKSCMLKKSTVFNFLYIFQLIQKVLTSNFLNLVLNIHICLYKNSKILFLLEKK